MKKQLLVFTLATFGVLGYIFFYISWDIAESKLTLFQRVMEELNEKNPEE